MCRIRLNKGPKVEPPNPPMLVSSSSLSSPPPPVEEAVAVRKGSLRVPRDEGDNDEAVEAAAVDNRGIREGGDDDNDDDEATLAAEVKELLEVRRLSRDSSARDSAAFLYANTSETKLALAGLLEPTLAVAAAVAGGDDDS
jgi:hypothetical protein